MQPAKVTRPAEFLPEIAGYSIPYKTTVINSLEKACQINELSVASTFFALQRTQVHPLDAACFSVVEKALKHKNTAAKNAAVKNNR